MAACLLADRLEMGITRNNHYVPERTLKRWSSNGTDIYAYRTLVSHPSMQEWKLRAISGVAMQKDLYTTAEEASDVDRFERLITAEYEKPGQDAIERLLGHPRHMSAGDWKRVGRFVALQHLRTPSTFIRMIQHANAVIPRTFEETTSEVLHRLESTKGREHLTARGLEPNPMSGVVRVRINPPTDGNSKIARVDLIANSARAFCLSSVVRLLDGKPARAMEGHHWSVIRAYGDEEWPLTDHPVVLLNFYGATYDLRGGFGKRKGDIFMPISPTEILHTEIGSKGNPRYFEFSQVRTRYIQRIVVENSFRWVFARKPLTWVPGVKARVVDAHAFKIEEETWREFHQRQSALENEFRNSTEDLTQRSGGDRDGS